MSIGDPQITEATPTNGEMCEGDRVYITAPDGKRIGFAYKPRVQRIPSFIIPAGATYYPEFEADPGVERKLSVKEGAYNRGGLGDILLALTQSLFGGGWNPENYVLASKDGARYEYVRGEGLKRIVDANGNISGVLKLIPTAKRVPVGRRTERAFLRFDAFAPNERRATLNFFEKALKTKELGHIY